MRRVQSEATDYWIKAKALDGTAKFKSTQTGNYDIYLPFIEQSINLLKPTGRMGFIAPNVWAVNDYGQGLRALLHESRRLDRWVDFKSYQIFEEAITYTALQFFSGTAVDGIKLHFAPNGGDDLASLDWSKIPPFPYSNLPSSDEWQFMPGQDWKLIQKLNKNSDRLDNELITKSIFQGLITSADSIYHLTRLDSGKYRSVADKDNPVEVEIEPDLMQPLVSGEEAKRYLAPKTNTYLLFPYCLSEARPRLFSHEEMESKFPKGWSYLRQHEALLRQRESGKFNTDSWYQFGRNQNIDKQELPKLIVAQTVPSLRLCFDHEGSFYLNNVRVNGILTINPAIK